MKDAFQQQHEEEGETVMGPMGRPIMSPEAMQRKMVRDRLKQEEVRISIISSMFSAERRIQKARIRKERVEKLAENLKNKLSIFTEAAKDPEDRAVSLSFREKCRLEAE